MSDPYNACALCEYCSQSLAGCAVKMTCTVLRLISCKNKLTKFSKFAVIYVVIFVVQDLQEAKRYFLQIKVCPCLHIM